VGIVVLVEVRDRDVGSFARERDAHGPTDPAVSARDERDAAVELGRTDVAVLAVIRHRRHRIGASGPRLLLGGWTAARGFRFGTLVGLRSAHVGVGLAPQRAARVDRLQPALCGATASSRPDARLRGRSAVLRRSRGRPLLRFAIEWIDRPSPWPTVALLASATALVAAVATTSPVRRERPAAVESRTICDAARGDHEGVADYGARGRSNCDACHGRSSAACFGSDFGSDFGSGRGSTSTSRITPATSATSATLKIGQGLSGQ
jgi:hypothetical protein